MPEISRFIVEVDANGFLKANKTLDEFSKKTKAAGKSSDDLSKKMDAFKLAANKLPEPLKSAASGLMGLSNPATAVTNAVMETAAAIQKFVKDSLDAFSGFEQSKKNLEIVMGSAEMAGRTFSDLQKLARKSPFDVEMFSDAAASLKNFGVSAKELIPTINMLGDASGGSAEKFKSIVQSYSAVLSAGTADADFLKQFQSAGVPIKKVLEEMGVTGNATAEQITEAFKKMTGEGGAFFNAMERGSDTLKGKTENLEGAWKEFKAAWVESTGLGELWKKVIDELTGAINDQTDALNRSKEAREYYDTVKSGDSTVLDDYVHAKSQIESLQKTLNGKFSFALSGSKDYLEWRNNIETQIASYERIIDANQRIVDLVKQRQDEEDELQSSIARSANEYDNLKMQIEDAYAKTAQGQKESIEAQIKHWQEALNAVHIEASTRAAAQWGDNSAGRQITTTTVKGISGEEGQKINAIIEMLQQSLDSLGKKAVTVTNEFKDWHKILASSTGFSVEDVSSWGGLETINKYIDDGVDAVRDRLLAKAGEGEGDGFIYELLGLNRVDVFNKAADDLENLLSTLTGARLKDVEPWTIQDASIRQLIETIREYRAEAKTVEEAANRVKQEEDYTNDMGGLNAKKEEFDIRKMLLGQLEEERKLREAIEKYGSEENAEAYLKLEKEVRALEELEAAYNNLKDTMGSIAQTAVLDFFSDMKKAFQDGKISTDEFGNAVRNMLRSIIDAMPQLLLHIGLKACAAGNWGVGLAFIGTSGLMSFVSGMMSDAEKSGNNDELNKLNKIQQQITDLIDAQRQQEEYYTQKKRNINAQAAINVNDAIITPKGVVHTSPKDYIIATKHPETMMSGGSAPVFVTINNNSSASVEVKENSSEDGSRQIEVLIDQIVKQGISSGRYDGAMDSMGNRRNGKRLNG